MAEQSSPQDFPPTLKKFYRCNENNYEALKNNYLWASFPYQFNDPFDCSYVLWDKESFISSSLDRNEQLGYILKTKGVVCLNSPENDFENLLWGYYTNQEGYCIEFDQKKLTFNDNNCKLLKVKYFDLNSFEKFKFSSDLNDYSLSLINWIILKEYIWEKENEWRYIFFDCNHVPEIELDKSDSRKKRYTKEAIRSITLGFKFFEGYLLSSTSNGFIYDLSKSKDEWKKQIINHLINETDYQIEWINLTEELKIVSRLIYLKFNEKDDVIIEFH